MTSNLPPGSALWSFKCSRALASTSRTAMSKRLSEPATATAGSALPSSSSTRADTSLQRSYFDKVVEPCQKDESDEEDTDMEVSKGEEPGGADREAGAASGVAPLLTQKKTLQAGPCLAAAPGSQDLQERSQEAGSAAVSYSCCSCGLKKEASPRVHEHCSSSSVACRRCQHRVFQKDRKRVGVKYSTD